MGEASSSLSDWLAWCFGNCWIARAFSENLGYRNGVVFLLHFYCNLFLMNGILTFSFLEQDSICYTALQTNSAPSTCLFFFFPIKNKQKTPSEKPIKPEQNKPIFLEAEVLVKSRLWKLICHSWTIIEAVRFPHEHGFCTTEQCVQHGALVFWEELGNGGSVTVTSLL